MLFVAQEFIIEVKLTAAINVILIDTFTLIVVIITNAFWLFGGRLGFVYGSLFS